MKAVFKFVFIVYVLLTVPLFAQNTKEQFITRTTVSKIAKGSHKVGYQVFTPVSYQKDSLVPLIIAFSPRGYGQGMVDKLKESVEKVGWIVIGCDSLRNNMKNDSLEIEMEDEVLNDIYANIPFNKQQLYLAGFSGGAMRAYGISARRKEKIAGILAYGGWLGGNDYQDVEYPEGMAVAMIVGNDDKGASKWIEIDTNTLTKRKNKVKLFKFSGAHEMAPSEITMQAIEWLKSEQNPEN